jgi:hypothetical protein
MRALDAGACFLKGKLTSFLAKAATLATALSLAHAGLLLSKDNDFVIPGRVTKTPPVIDGILDDEVWQNAPWVSDFIQFEPDKNQPASLKTIVKVLYDDEAIYFGFFCYDPEPERIVLGMNKRDALTMGTDTVTVSLDTFYDKRTAYYFRTNPAGVQHDGRISENGRVAETQWDGIWQSAGASIDEGWSAEIRVPMETMKYQPGQEVTWGIKVSRYIPRRFEKSFWSEPLQDTYRKVSTYGALEGLNLAQAANRAQFIPHVISKFEQGEKSDFDAGLDARYDLLRFISGHLTVNPDFATVEADQERVNLTRFELGLREKRNFFLEGNEIFQQRIKLFYSRRVADIYGGGRLYGKTGGYEFGALSTQTNESDEEGGSANFTVLRLKRDVLSSSNIGVLAANKHVQGRNQGTFGLDTSLYFTDTFSFTGQLATGYRSGSKSDYAFFLRPSYDTSTFHTHLRYTFLGDKFGDYANAVGFIPDDNRHELDSDLTKTFWLNKGHLERLSYSSNYNIYWGMDKVLRSWKLFQSLQFDLRNRFSFRMRHDQEYKLFEKDFRNHSSTVELGYNTREYQSARINYRFGRNFDSDFGLLGASARKNITSDLAVEYGLSYLSQTPDPQNKSTWIHSVRATQYFNKDLFVKLFFQTNTAIEKRNTQVVFVYRFQPPFGLLQLAYQRGTARFGERGNQGHTLFIKLAGVF